MLTSQSRILLIGAFLIWLTCAATAQCTDKPFAPCKLYANADAVFIGTVKEISYSEPFDEVAGLSKKRLRNKMALLTIKESFKGIAEKQPEITVTTTQIQQRSQSGELAFKKYADLQRFYPECSVRLEVKISADSMIFVFNQHDFSFPLNTQDKTAVDCDFDEFVQDETYLVYAKRKSSERNSVFLADHAMLVAEADNAITYLHNLKAGAQSTMLYGRIVRKVKSFGFGYPETIERPIRNIKVEIQSEKQFFTTTTDEKGNYLFSEFSPDEYSINYDLPDHLETEANVEKLLLSAKSCTEQNIVALTMGRISGTVFSHDGKPQVATTVDLVVASEANHIPRLFEVASNNQSGTFEFKHIPPGQYFLGFSLTKSYAGSLWGRVRYLEMTPRTYYPGVADISQATLITLAEGQQLKDLDFYLLPPLATRIISGLAVTSDGKPVANAAIVLMGALRQLNESGDITKTDEYGRFSLPAYNDLKYWINANISVKGEDKHSEPIDLSTNGDINSLTLVVSSSGKFCSLCYNKYWKRKGTPPQ